MLIIDTYNVLGVTGVLPPEHAGLGVDGLARLVGGSRWGRDPVRLVCDGVSPAAEHRAADRGIGRVRAEYAGGGREADERIERLIAQSSAPKRLTVVSSDRRLRIAARKRRCRWLSSEAFLRALLSDAAKPGRKAPKPAFTKDVPLKAQQVRAWRAEFGPEADELADAAGRAETVRPTPSKPEETKPKRSEPPPPPKPASEPDPLLDEALEEWRGRLSMDDLDMSRWLGENESS